MPTKGIPRDFEREQGSHSSRSTGTSSPVLPEHRGHFLDEYRVVLLIFQPETCASRNGRFACRATQGLSALRREAPTPMGCRKRCLADIRNLELHFSYSLTYRQELDRSELCTEGYRRGLTSKPNITSAVRNTTRRPDPQRFPHEHFITASSTWVWPMGMVCGPEYDDCSRS